MNNSPTINVLIIAQQLAEGDKLINALRRAGYSVNAEAVRDETFLRERMIAKRWDFVCLFTDADQISPQRLSKVLRELEKDIGCLIIGDGDLPAILQANIPGARIIASLDKLDSAQQASMLTRVVNQELNNLENRRNLRKMGANFKELETRYQSLLASSADAIAYLHNGLHIFANDTYFRLLQNDDKQGLINTSLLDFVDEPDVDRVREFLRQPQFKLTDACVFQLKENHGPSVRVSMQCTPVEYDSESCLQTIIRPATGNARQQLYARELLSRDLVTGVLNEGGLVAEIDKTISDALYGDTHAMVKVLSLVGFEELVAIAGKPAGNLLLADIARITQKLAPAGSHIGRVGASNFAILCREANSEQPLSGIENQLSNAIADLLPAHTSIQIKTGTSAVNELSIDGSNVLARAQRYLNVASLPLAGSSPGKNDATKHMFTRLEDAISNESFVLAFQPIVNLKEDGVERYEVRIRLQEKDHLIYPPSFLELANQSGLGEKIDRWVIAKSLALLQEQADSSLQLTINLTHNSLVSPDFLPWLSESLRDTRVSTDRLILQISELDIVSFEEQVSQFCGRLQELEIALAVTHFGCTLSPFKYLPKEQAKYVKLDRSLLDDIEIDAEKRESLASTVESLHASGILVIAPMIDKIELLPLLWQANLNFVQGNSLQEPSDRMNYSFVQEEEITLSSF